MIVILLRITILEIHNMRTFFIITIICLSFKNYNYLDLLKN